jgi:replicative DNA helicase
MKKRKRGDIMINDQAIQEIKKHLGDYLQELGLSTHRPFNCVNPQHTDKHPSMSYDKTRDFIKCFSCDHTYDIISLYALNNNLDNDKDFKKIVEDLALKYNVNLKGGNSKIATFTTPKKENYTRYINKCKKDIGKSDYLIKRGISEETEKKYNIGYDTSKKMIILPISNTCYIGRYTDDTNSIKHHKPKGTTNELFNSIYLKDSDYKTIIWVNESIIDSLSLEEVKKDIKAISLNSTSNAKQLVQEAKDNNYKGVFILALDTDTTGINASIDLQEDLEAIGIKSFIFNRDNTVYNTESKEGQEVKNKDINEWLLSDRTKLTNSVNSFNDMLLNSLETQAKKLYEKENVLNFLDTFSDNIKDKERNKPLSTGIKKLDEALEGGFYKKNLVILGAISSLGKTTLALQIGDNIARNGNDVLIFSLEMSKEELIAKSLSRNSYLKAYDKNYTALALTTREILKGVATDEKDQYYSEKRANLYNEAYEDYKENIASNVYITECNDSIEININTINDKIKNHIAITNTKPFVIIDYLQIIQNQERGLTDKQVIDKIVTSLKRMARDNDITILLISAFNRASYNQESNLASFRDSSTIEYTSDVLISLQHEILDGVTDDKKKVNTNQEQQKDKRDLTLKVLKNRNGRITDIKDITFYAKYNYMDFNE